MIYKLENPFYFYPTMKKNPSTELTREESAKSDNLPMFQCYVQEVLKYQYLINIGLNLNSSLFEQLAQETGKKSYSNISSPFTNIAVVEPQKFEKNEIPLQKSGKKKTQSKRKSKKKQIYSEEDEYKPSDDQQCPMRLYKISQTKNVPKNFGKAIIRFIKKNSDITNSVIELLNLDKEDFLSVVQNMRDRINTIADLRSLWVEEENKYAKPIRILSNQYLRKFNLNHVFNSRVENHAKHIKYRHKILKALEKPEQFTYIKDY